MLFSSPLEVRNVGICLWFRSRIRDIHLLLHAWLKDQRGSAFVVGLDQSQDKHWRFEAAVMASGWTIDTLKEFFDQRLDSMDRALIAARLDAKEAIQKSDAATEKRFDGVNEFRAQLGDQARTLMPRTEAEQRLDQISEKQLRIEAKLERQEGKSGGLSAIIPWLLAGGSLVVAIIMAMR